MTKHRVIVMEVHYSRCIVTEHQGLYDRPEEALNQYLQELNLGEGSIIVHEAKAYEHPIELETLPEHCSANCLKFLTKKRQRRLKELVANQEHNLAQTGAWLIENDPEWAIV